MKNNKKMPLHQDTEMPFADHRIRTGAMRREATRRKLLSAALKIFAEKGTEAPSIDDFIAAAGIARGTFYNYFDTTGGLLDAVTAELSDEVLASIEAYVIQISDPVQRIVCGCLLYMQIAVDHPAWGGFIVQTAAHSRANGRLVDVYLVRDLTLAQKEGRISFPTVTAARDLVIGSIRQAIQSVLSKSASQNHLCDVMQMVLVALGIEAVVAQKICLVSLPLLDLPAGIKSLEAASTVLQH